MEQEKLEMMTDCELLIGWKIDDLTEKLTEQPWSVLNCLVMLAPVQTSYRIKRQVPSEKRLDIAISNHKKPNMHSIYLNQIDCPT